MSRRRSGINPIAYLGVEPITPPELLVEHRAPNSHDINYNIGTIWLQSSTDSLWVLTRLQDIYTAVWTPLDTGTAGAEIFPGNSGQANVLNSVLNIIGDTTGVVSTVGAGNTMTVGIPSSATKGQLVMSGPSGTQAIWGTVTSADASIAITTSTTGVLDLRVSGGAGATSFPTNSGIAVPSAGVLRIFGGSNINTAVSTSNTVVVNLNNSILLPVTASDASAGVLALGTSLVTNHFLHNYGTNNTFLGNQAGSLSLTTGSATDNTGIGLDALNVITTGAFNTAVGSGSLDQLTTGSRNVGFGETTLTNLVTGSDNIAIGRGAGSQYTSSESSNIVIGNTGTTSDSSHIRIGTSQTSTSIAGIYNQAVGGTNAIVYIDSTGKLGTTGGSGSNFVSSVTTDVSGPITPNAGSISILGVTNQLSTDGSTAHTVKVGFVTNPQVTGTLTAGTGLVATTGNISATAGQVNAGTSMSAATTITAGTGITATTGNIAASSGNVTASAHVTGGTGVTATTGGLTATAGGLTVTAGTITFTPFTAGTLLSSSAGVISSLAHGTNAQLLIGHTGSAPVWGSLTSSGATIAITFVGNNINLESVGTGSGAVTFHTDGADAMASGAAITIHGGSNITTSGAASTVTVALVNSPSVSGSVTAGTGLIATTGGVTATAGGLTATAGGLTVTAGTITFTPLTAGTVRSSGTGVISSLADGSNGQLLIGKTGDVPIWANITSTGGSVVITNGANSINLEAAGVAALTQLSTDVAGPVLPSAGNINVTGGSNISTDGTTAHQMKINLVNSPSVSGSVTAGTGLIATTGGITATGTSNINTSGSAVTTIGTGGTGAVNIGNATGNTAVTGSLTASNGLTATAGGITATGTSAINTTGSAVTTIGTGGTGAVNIGNATGNTAVTGQLSTTGNIAGGGTITAASGVTATTGGLTAVAGGLTVTAGTITFTPFTTGVLTSNGTGIISSQNLGLGVVQSTSAGALSASVGDAGRILIGTSTGTAPVWATLTAGANVTITNASGSITISASGGGGGSGATTFVTSSGTATVSGTTIQILSGENTNTDGSSNIVHVNLNHSIVQPVTSADGTAGVYSLGTSIQNDPFMHAYGTNNTFLGQRAGAGASLIPSSGNPFTFTGTRNVGIGFNALQSITTGNRNTAVGAAAVNSITTGSDNVGIGRQALAAVTTGGTNVAVGQNSGLLLTTGTNNTLLGDSAGSVLGVASSSNILISNVGNSGDNNTIRIGTAGSSAGQQNRAFIAGIEGVTIGSPVGIVNINANGQMGSTLTPTLTSLTLTGALTSHGIVNTGNLSSTGTTTLSGLSAGAVVADASGNLSSVNGTAGYVLTSNGAGSVPSFQIITPVPASTCSFRATQTSNFTNVTGDASTFTLSSGLSVNFNVGGVLSGGTFTAPATGYYYLEISVCFNNLASLNLSSCYELIVGFTAGGTTYKTYNTAIQGAAGVGWLAGKDQQSFPYSAFVSMSSGQTAVFFCSLLATTASKTAGVGPVTSATAGTTYLAGYRVA